jgi:D-erythronate 2-dehydrogenase
VQVLVGSLIDQCPVFANQQFDTVFHLAAAVSAECEGDFDLGLRSNLDSSRTLLDALRAAGNRPRFVFASSAAVFGSDPGLPMPPIVRDDTLPTPQTSYGIQKFICEQLVADYTRKRFIDGRWPGLTMTVIRRTLHLARKGRRTLRTLAGARLKYFFRAVIRSMGVCADRDKGRNSKGETP